MTYAPSKAAIERVRQLVASECFDHGYTRPFAAFARYIDAQKWRPMDAAPTSGRLIWAFCVSDDPDAPPSTWQGAIAWNETLLGGKEPSWIGLPRTNPEWAFDLGLHGPSTWQPPRLMVPKAWRPMPEPPEELAS